MAPDVAELRDRADKTAADERLAPVSVTMAILAVFAAVSSLMAGRLHAEAMLAQTVETDQWAQYQAKIIRERSYQLFLDQMSIFSVQDPAHAEELKATYSKEIQRYTAETADIQKQATATEKQVQALERGSDCFDFGDILLESSVVICSITLLTRRRMYWYLGLLFGSAGTVISAAGLFLR